MRSFTSVNDRGSFADLRKQVHDDQQATRCPERGRERVDRVAKRRIVDDAAVPIVMHFAGAVADVGPREIAAANCRSPVRGAARSSSRSVSPTFLVGEPRQLAALDVDGGDHESRLAGVERDEVDCSRQRPQQRMRIVEVSPVRHRQQVGAETRRSSERLQGRTSRLSAWRQERRRRHHQIIPQRARAVGAHLPRSSAPTTQAALMAPIETPVTTLSDDLSAVICRLVHQIEQRENAALFVSAERAAALQNQADLPFSLRTVAFVAPVMTRPRFQQIPNVIPTALQQRVDCTLLLASGASAVSSLSDRSRLVRQMREIAKVRLALVSKPLPASHQKLI